MISDEEKLRVAQTLKYGIDFYYEEELDSILSQILKVDEDAFLPEVLAEYIMPNIEEYDWREDNLVCPKCGSKDIYKSFTDNGVLNYLMCKNCGSQHFSFSLDNDNGINYNKEMFRWEKDVEEENKDIGD